MAFDLSCETDWLVYADYLAESGDVNGEEEVREDFFQFTQHWYWIYGWSHKVGTKDSVFTVGTGANNYSIGARDSGVGTGVSGLARNHVGGGRQWSR